MNNDNFLPYIMEQVRRAYTDCNRKKAHWDCRLLEFKCNKSVEAKDLLPLLNFIGQYNQFNPKVVAEILNSQFGDSYKFYIAREFSPCIYIESKENDRYIDLDALIRVKKMIEADEIGLVNNQIRLWWD